MKSKKIIPEGTGELFDTRVEDYDLFVRSTVPGYDKIIRSIGDLVRVFLSSVPRPKVLDLGIGTGNTSLVVLRECPTASIVGYDVSAKMVARAKERPKKFNVKVVCDDVLNINYRNEFDLAVSSIVYHHLDGPEKQRGYKKVFDALKNNGVFILADVMGSDDPDLNQLLEKQWAEFMKRKRGTDFRDSILELGKKHHKPSTLNENIHYLNKQGFRTSVYWRVYEFCHYLWV
jgi:tRNA (cmo5U34)-methyltransferase